MSLATWDPATTVDSRAAARDVTLFLRPHFRAPGAVQRTSNAIPTMVSITGDSIEDSRNSRGDGRGTRHQVAESMSEVDVQSLRGPLWPPLV